MAVFIERFNKDSNEWVGLSEVGRFAKVEQAQGVIDQLVRCGEDAPLRVTAVPRGRPKGSGTPGTTLGHSKRRYRTLMRKIEEMTHEADELYNLLAEHDAVPTLDTPNYTEDREPNYDDTDDTDVEENTVEVPSLPSMGDEVNNDVIDSDSVSPVVTGTDGGF